MTDLIDMSWSERVELSKKQQAEIERLRGSITDMDLVAKQAEELRRLTDENAKLQAVVDAQREYHERNLNDARAYRADPSHRCDWRVRIEAIESRSRAALAALETDDG